MTELTLALVLFSDASRVNLGGLRSDKGLPARLLFVGLPLTIALGFVAAMLLTNLNPWLCALAAATLAPTDAALGAPVVADPHVPLRIRRTLNVESGLNDGIVTPVVTFFLAGAVTEAGVTLEFAPASGLVAITVGVLVGIAVGYFGGQLLAVTRSREWNTPSSTAVVFPTLALLAYFAALHLDANGFVAAFVGGLAFGSTQRGNEEVGEFGEQLGELLGLVVWLMVGALMIGLLNDVTWGMIVFAVACPDRAENGTGRVGAGRHPVEWKDRSLHRLVRSPGSGLDRLRHHGARLVAGRRGTHDGLDRAADGRAQRLPPRHHRRSSGPAIRGERERSRS